MCVLSIKVLLRKKFGNLFNDPRILALFDVQRDSLHRYINAIVNGISSSLLDTYNLCHLFGVKPRIIIIISSFLTVAAVYCGDVTCLITN